MVSTYIFSQNGITQNRTTSISLRNINSLKRSLQFDDNIPYQPTKTQKQHHSADKYNAFGAFVTASLLDMPENNALALIEKFTNEIVRALIDNSNN